MVKIELPHDWEPRPYQLPVLEYLDGGGDRACTVWHRRAGKDATALNYTAKSAFERVGTYWHLLPEQRQARKVIWNGLDKQGRRFIDQAFPPEVRAKKREDEMLMELVNGSLWQLAGADNYNSLVGSNVVGVVFSEWSLTDPAAWDYIRPILAENNGWAWFIYTPRGKNHGYQTLQRALKSQRWFAEVLTAEDTGAITKAAIEQEAADGMSDALIRQEFYCSFEAPNDVQFINPNVVKAAQDRAARVGGKDAKVIGVDVARFGDDRTVIVERQGHKVLGIYKYAKLDTMKTAGLVADRISAFNPVSVFIDGVGVGGGVVDRLTQLGHTIIEVNGGASANDEDRWYNKRAECWGRMRDWLAHRGDIPANETELEFDLIGPSYTYDPKNRVQLEKKEKMKERGLASPDIGDALALTFAEHVGNRAYKPIVYSSKGIV